MKAKSSLQCRVNDLENRMNILSKEKKGKMNEAKTVLSSILILEKVWKLVKHFFSELNL
jgi:hypothetical protein